MPNGNPKKLVAARLKGRASGFTAVRSAGGTNEDLLCGTVGIAVVILAVLNVADDTLNVLLVGLAAAAVLVHFVHFSSPFLVLAIIIGRAQSFYSFFTEVPNVTLYDS